MIVEREFKINKYITLKFRGNITSIYIADELFEQCKHLLLNIPIEQAEDFEEIESIDAAAEKLGSIEGGNIRGNYEISPSAEFWGHCSNLQAWVENNYDTRILHRTLAFPLLKKLSDVGDPLAKRVFKEEIARRFESGHSTVIQYLLQNKYLEYLDNDEILLIIKFILEDTNKLEENSRTIYLILKKLTDIGNHAAKQILKDYIINRFENGSPEIIQYLKDEKCLNYLSNDEILALIKLTLKNVKNHKENYEQYIRYCKIYSILKKLINDGDFTARQIFKEELTEKFKEGRNHLIGYLINGKFLKYLTNLEAFEILLQVLNNPDRFKNNHYFLHPLFKRITDAASRSLNRRLKKSLINFLNEGDPEVISYLMEAGYFHYLSNKDLVLLKNPFDKKIKEIISKPLSTGDQALDKLLSGGFHQGLIYLLYGDNKFINEILLTISVISQKFLSKGGLGEAIRIALIHGDNHFNPYLISMTAIPQDLRPHYVLANIFLRRVINWNHLIDILKNKLSFFIDLKFILISGISMLLDDQKKSFQRLLGLIKAIKSIQWPSNPSIIILAPKNEHPGFDTLSAEEPSDSEIVTIKIEDNEFYTSYTVGSHIKFPEKKLSNIRKLKI